MGLPSVDLFIWVIRIQVRNCQLYYPGCCYYISNHLQIYPSRVKPTTAPAENSQFSFRVRLYIKWLLSSVPRKFLPDNKWAGGSSTEGDEYVSLPMANDSFSLRLFPRWLSDITAVDKIGRRVVIAGVMSVYECLSEWWSVPAIYKSNLANKEPMQPNISMNCRFCRFFGQKVRK